MSTLMRFDLGGDSLVFEAGADYPASRSNRVIQVRDRTASGALQVETLGVQVRTRVLNFNLMSKTDYDNLVDWFLNVSNGAEKSFTFTDEYGNSGFVKIVDDIIDFQETSLERYSGTVTLEYV